jgi:cell division protein FtsL
MVRRIPSKQKNSRQVREQDRGALFRLGLLLLCGLTLAGGFVFAGVQHFAALRYGYQTENLRKIRSELTEDHRRFLLEREEAASPARLEKAARQIGMQPMQAAQIDPLNRVVKSSAEKNAPATISSSSSPARTNEAKLIRPKPR